MGGVGSVEVARERRRARGTVKGGKRRTPRRGSCTHVEEEKRRGGMEGWNLHREGYLRHLKERGEGKGGGWEKPKLDDRG